MPNTLPGMRPLTLLERGISTQFGMIPPAIAIIAARAVFLLLHVVRGDVTVTFWDAVRYVTLVFALDTDLPMVIGVVRIPGPQILGYDIGDVPFVLPDMFGSWMYPVFYFSYGRTLGHMVVNARVVHHRTGRRMRTWQKLVRSLPGLHPILFPLFAFLSLMLVLVDRQRRRSAFDWMAGTVVVVGDPVADEPATARERGWASGLFGRLTGRSHAGEAGG